MSQKRKREKVSRMFLEYITSVMTGSRHGFMAVLTGFVLKMLSYVYSFGIRVIELAYICGIRKVYAAPLLVVSVGNLTLGGTGKTPVVVLISDHYKERGKKPAVLTRGYGNDESRMLAGELNGVPVYTGQDRLKSALLAAKDKRDIAILDDGFQHRRLRRDLNILLIDGRNLFGNGFIFPRGVLREPIGSAERADLIIVTKTNNLSEDRIREIKEYAVMVSGNKPVVIAKHSPVSFTDNGGSILGLDEIRGREIFAVSGIADPVYFDDILTGLGAKIKKRFFYQDHHKYTQSDIDRISAEGKSLGIDLIVTTAKDLVKIKDLDISGISNKLLVLNIRIEITEGKENLIAGLDSVFGRNGR